MLINSVALDKLTWLPCVLGIILENEGCDVMWLFYGAVGSTYAFKSV